MLRGIKNDQAKVVTPCEPWAYTPNVPNFADKSAYLKWRGDASTDHLLFTGAEGVNADLRCNRKTNPVRKLHALIADYDVKIAQVMEDHIVAAAPIDLRPNWVSTTYSGGRRLVWLFDEPIVFDDVLAKRFLEVAGQELRVADLLPGLDDPSWLSVYKIYDVGTAWKELSPRPLPTSQLHAWLVEASKRTDWTRVGELHIPLEDVAVEVHKQHPGAWNGDFTLGARGSVFWEGRSNPSAAVVTEAGMIAFSSHKLFHTWGEILGAAFIRKYQADKIGAAVANVWFDGQKYYRKLKGSWDGWGKADFEDHLCVNFKMDSGKSKHETASETAAAMVFIRENQKVEGLVPRLFDERDIIDYAGKRYLNTSRVQPIQPVDTPQEWGVNFPWMARFLEMRFEVHERDVLFAWWKRFYSSALEHDLLKGQTLFLVGGVKLGKTLLSHVMIGASVGGAADASTHITKGSEFNKELFEVALRTIDDGEVASDPASHRKFSEAIKRQVANPTMAYRAMYRDAQSIIYNGRIIVTLNDDTYSLQMIPDLEMSMVEKVLILQLLDSPYKFPPNREVENMIAAELPYFLRWLLDWHVPDEVAGDNRLGVKSYINEDLRARALHSGQAGDLLDVIALWIKRNAIGEKDGCWTGSATEWLGQAAGDDFMRSMVSKYTPRVVGKRFSEAARIPDSGVTILDSDRKHGNVYQICVTQEVERKTVRVTV